MELRRELLLTVGLLVLLNLLIAWGAIGLLLRMGPAIERILQENVYSIVAAEEVLAEFAVAGGEPLDEAAATRVRAALANARASVTEDGEAGVLRAVEAGLPGALGGADLAREDVVEGMRVLIEINRDAMSRVDEEARRLSSAGAWAAAFAGFLSFAASLIVVTRIQRRFVRPLADMYEVLESARQGGRHRRCRPTDAPHEVVQVAQSVNRLLDERMRHTAALDQE